VPKLRNGTDCNTLFKLKIMGCKSCGGSKSGAAKSSSAMVGSKITIAGGSYQIKEQDGKTVAVKIG